MVIKAKWQKGNAWKGIGEYFCRCRVMGYPCVDNFRASCLPWTRLHGQWTGKIEGEKHNLTSRNSSVSTRTPACIQLIKMQSQINVRRRRVWRVANVRACVWLCFHADRRNLAWNVFARAVRWLKLWGRSWAVTEALSAPWRAWFMSSSVTNSPFSCGRGEDWYPASFPAFPPPSIIRFCVQIYYHPVCHFNMLRNAGTGLVLFFHWPFFDLGETIEAELCQKMGTDRKENKAAQSGD